MKITMLSKLLYVAGIIATVTAIIQWYVKFPDVSQLVFGLHIALTFIMAAYLHSALRNLGLNIEDKDKKIKEVNKALDIAIDYIRDVENYAREVEKLAKSGEEKIKDIENEESK